MRRPKGTSCFGTNEYSKKSLICKNCKKFIACESQRISKLGSLRNGVRKE